MYEEKKADYSWKLILVGDGASGKTTFVRRHVFGEYATTYQPTVGCNVHVLDFTTNKGIIEFNCWDTAGQEHFGGLRDGYYIGADCAIIMFDLSFRNSYKSVPLWYRDLSRTCYDIPVAIVGNKVDLRDKELDAEQQEEQDEQIIRFKRRYGTQYIEISARRNVNYEKPFLYLMRRMLKHSNVYFTKEVALIPPDIMPDELTRAEMDRLRDIALTKTLPIDDLEL